MATRKAYQVVKAACQAVIPAGGLLPSDWADSHRVLSPEASAEPGRWKTSRVPYAKEWLDSVADPYVHTVVLMTSSQVGKSEVLNNICGYFIHHDPCPILLMQPTLDRAKDYSKKRIAPMIRDTPALAAVTSNESSRDSDNTTLSKSFVGGHLLIVGANAASALASNPIRVILADEVDRYPQDVDDEGSPLALAIVRTRTFTNRKVVITSTPTTKDNSEIESSYEETDKRRYFVPCPHCGKMQTLKFKETNDGEDTFRLIWEVDPEDDEKVTEVYYACEEGCLIEPHHKLRMLEEGEWISERPHSGKVGFHINALYSVWYSWKEIAEDFIKASKQAKSGRPERLKVFVNTTLGETWDANNEKSDVTGLESRAEEYAAEVPLGVLAITAGVDVQPDRIECEIVGWGMDYESWSLDYQIFYGDTNKPQVWQELKSALSKEFECEREDARGERLIRTIDAACIDSGGHNTDAVYGFTKAHRGNKWIAIKGASVRQREVITKRPSKPQPGVLLYTIDTIYLKGELFNKFAVPEPGAGYCHFPVGYDGEYYKQLGAEKRVKKVKKFDKSDPFGYSQYTYKKIRSRNEALDCRVYALAAVYHLNFNFARELERENLQCSKNYGKIIHNENSLDENNSIRNRMPNLGSRYQSWRDIGR